MTAISNPRNTYPATEFSGKTRVVPMFNLQMTTAVDTIELSAVSNGISAIQNVYVCSATAPSATFTSVGASFSDMVVTINAVGQAGAAATTFNAVNLLVIGTG